MSSNPPPGRDGHWERISTLFEAVLSLPSHQRAAFLDETCGSDEFLRRELQSLVTAQEGAPEFLEAFYADVIHPALSRDDPRPSATDAAAELSAAVHIEPGDRIRHFTVLERLGQGGSGVVYRGRDTMLERDVAMKFLAPSLSQDAAARARLIREAQAASGLEDPNVCAIYAVETTVDGGVCIVMGYCAGGTLRERLKRGSLSATEIDVIALHLARGLASAHRAGIVHGDIKPANVGFGDGGVARLLDFGVATQVRDSTPGTRGLSGTLPYLAPELWRGGTRGPRTDVWALGVTFFEMVTGRRPFVAEDPRALADAILAGVLPPLRRPDGLPIAPAFEALIYRMLRTSPDERPADGDAVLAALVESTQPQSLASAAVATPDASPAPVRTHWTRRITIGVGVAASAALIWANRPSPAAVTVPPRALEVARSSEPLSSIAVLPFTTRGGADIAYLANGMVDLLTPAFDATGLVRGIDPNTVIGAAGEQRVGLIDSSEARALAASVRADRYVVGSVVGSGTTLTFRAVLRRLDGREVGRAQTTVSETGALAAGADALVRQLIATELLAPGDTIAGVAAATTSSTQALRAYLDGERELRDARPAAAVAHFLDAVVADSMFALAWYRLARAARWNDVDSLSARAAQRAAALAASLPPRQQTLVRAYHALRFGSARDAERRFAQIVSDYPTDVEAWMLLGEAQFGSNPFHGRPIADAGAAFQRVMALDPRNREVTVYLMELAAAANRLGQLDTLFSMYFSPNSAGEQPGIRATYIALHRRRVGSAAPRRGSPDPVDDPALAQVALSRIGADVRDRGAARAYARVVASAPASRVNGLLALATLAAADGAWPTAAGHIADAAALDPDAAAEHRALLALAPSVTMSADSLRAVRLALLTGSATRIASGDALTSAEHDDLRQYLAGLLSVRLGDSAGVASAKAALSRRSAADSRLALPLSQAIVGQAHLRSGNLAAALVAFEQCTPDLPARVRARYPALAQHVDRLARAETLQRLGREREAMEWYRSVREGVGMGVAGTPFVAAADSGVRRTGAR